MKVFVFVFVMLLYGIWLCVVWLMFWLLVVVVGVGVFWFVVSFVVDLMSVCDM